MSRSRREILSVLIAMIALFALVATSYAASTGRVMLPLGKKPSVVPPPRCKKHCPKEYDEPSVVVPPKPKPKH
jgi:hypothetical protein